VSGQSVNHAREGFCKANRGCNNTKLAPELLIITIMRRFLFALLTLLVFHGAKAENDSSSNGVSARGVIHEMNLARTNPAAYATHIEQMRANFHGNVLVLPGRTMWRTKEGIRALDEAIRFLHRAQPLPPLALSPGMSRAAADHCADQAGGQIGHGDPAGRMNRYGRWGSRWGENVSYGKSSARDIILALIIDDGLPGRKHRKNIFNPAFNVAGAAYGAHARYRSVCSIEFAGSFAEQRSPTETLVARNP
jgi:uncharacterized protein YkwD